MRVMSSELNAAQKKFQAYLAGSSQGTFRALISEQRPTQSDAGQRRCCRQEREPVMGAEKKAKNKAKVIKGKTKRLAGKATGNERLEAEGKADVVTGNLKNAGEKVKDAFRR
jgi:uncharacterized protein YjbJ (UPF0337 family)